MLNYDTGTHFDEFCGDHSDLQLTIFSSSLVDVKDKRFILKTLLRNLRIYSNHL